MSDAEDNKRGAYERIKLSSCFMTQDCQEEVTLEACVLIVILTSPGGPP